jgi:hypothetical protein
MEDLPLAIRVSGTYSLVWQAIRTCAVGTIEVMVFAIAAGGFRVTVWRAQRSMSAATTPAALAMGEGRTGSFTTPDRVPEKLAVPEVTLMTSGAGVNEQVATGAGFGQREGQGVGGWPAVISSGIMSSVSTR